MILVIDNYDSFTFNLVQYLLQMDKEICLKRNDEITIEETERMKPTHILISPGPGNPDSAGNCLSIVDRFAGSIPIFGVCLGHQIIAQAFGAEIVKADRPMHGKTTLIEHDGKGIFKNLDNPLLVTRYHSLIVDPKTLPSSLIVSAVTEKGEIMSLRHTEYQVEGIQAHPEAILTRQGLDLLGNFFEERTVQI